MATFSKNKHGFYLSDLVDNGEIIIADGIFKGMRVTKLKEENGEYDVTFTGVSKNKKPIFSIKIKEPYVDEDLLAIYFVDYLSNKCATKIVNFAFNNFTKEEEQHISEREIPTSLKNTPPAFFLFYKDLLVESANRDTAALTVKKEKTCKNYFSDNYHQNATKKFEECVNRTFDNFFQMCNEKVWNDKSANFGDDKNIK